MMKMNMLGIEKYLFLILLTLNCSSAKAGGWESFSEIFGYNAPIINDFRPDPNNWNLVYMGTRRFDESALVADYSNKSVYTLLEGASSIAINSNNSSHLTAGTWDYYDLSIGATTPKTIVQSFDAGNTWTEVSNSNNIPTSSFEHINYSLNGSNRLFLYSNELALHTGVGCCNGLSISDDNGESWIAANGINNRFTIGPLTFNRNTPEEMYAKQGSSQVMRSIDGGTNWNLMGSYPINTRITGASDIEAGFNSGTLFTGAVEIIDQQFNTQAVILKTEDGGASWDTIDIQGIFPNITDIFAIEASDYVEGLVYFAGRDSVNDISSIFKSTDNGDTWEPLPDQLTGWGFPVGSITELVSGPIGENGEVILYASDQTAPYRYSDMVSAVPVPAAVWLFGSGLLGLVGMARRKKA